MRRLLVGDFNPDNLFELQDPSVPSEEEFSQVAGAGVSRVFDSFHCVPFRGRFLFDGSYYRPDMLMVARDFSHWCVVEVELASHSLDGHVLPQLRAFRYGEPHAECASILAEAIAVPIERAEEIVRFVPSSVVVIANQRLQSWEEAFRGIGDVKYIVVSVFSSGKRISLEVDGDLQVGQKSVGFGAFSALDRSLVFPGTTDLPEGSVQFESSSGISRWLSRRAGGLLWLTCENGLPGFCDGVRVQVLRGLGRQILRVVVGGSA